MSSGKGYGESMKTIALPLFLTLAACGGTFAPTEPAPVTTSDAGQPPTVFPPTEPLVVPSAPDAAEPDLSAFVCTVADGGDIACDTSTHQFWSWCPEQACLQSVGCDQAIEKGYVHPGDACLPLAGEIGVVNAK